MNFSCRISRRNNANYCIFFVEAARQNYLSGKSLFFLNVNSTGFELAKDKIFALSARHGSASVRLHFNYANAVVLLKSRQMFAQNFTRAIVHAQP